MKGEGHSNPYGLGVGMDEESKESPQRFGIPFGYPSVVGAYLAVNAVPDTWMLVDSADCATLRAELIHDNHDWHSSLITVDGRYRIASSGVCPNTVALGRNEGLAAQIEQIGKSPGSFLFVYPAPVTAIVGLDYNVVINEVADRLAMKALAFSPVEAVGDWLIGYALMMETIARHIELPDVKPVPDTVAFVGYLWDRNEGDHEGSVRELKTLVRALGLEVSSVWFSGVPTEDLSRVATASIIVELPYAGKAASILAERTGARVIKAGLPTGLQGTFDWMERLGEATGRSAKARAFIERSGPRFYDRVAKSVLEHFVGKDFMIATEANLAIGLGSLVAEFGGQVRLLGLAGGTESEIPFAAETVLRKTTLEALGSAVTRLAEHSSQPLLIGNEQAIATVGYPDLPVVPMGFQSGGSHFLYDAPFLGLGGALSLIDRIGNTRNLMVLRKKHYGATYDPDQ